MPVAMCIIVAAHELAALTRAKPTGTVGIDFGTYATGFAYCELTDGGVANDPRVMLHFSWPEQPAPDPKTCTAAIYRGRQLWGWPAWRRWCSLPPAERLQYAYLENFKLLLEPTQGLHQAPAGEAGGGGRPNFMYPNETLLVTQAFGKMNNFLRLHIR
ncbi:hypothetical protein GPECTOR_43g891 [Gonium pectorale]|uniref:Uncharacterized protein n=1 Tax=Gonium pectorale TaxID=33097 RepID=A0A150GA60_GONPE|nr:hypothetical protein GPECTOR_43g891 [Gonium pectorale]|eukprot:KXZ46455.1 hypothetical protein GPECTOR_43g891 [Gonium pectorale]